MNQSTVYDVRILYQLDDKASRGLGGLEQQARAAEKSLFSMSSVLTGVAVAAGTLAVGKKLLVDFNAEMESMRISMATIMSMQLDMPFARAQTAASGLVDEFQELAKASPSTTKDFVSMAQLISSSVLTAGGSIEQLRDMTQGAVLSASAMAMPAQFAAQDIRALIQGTVSARDQLAQFLLAANKIDQKDWNGQAMTAAERLEKTAKMLKDSKLGDAGEAMGKSWNGTLSTLIDEFQITMGQVGLPLVKAMVEEVQKLNTWVSKNRGAIGSWVKEFGTSIKDGFLAVRDALSWVVEHRDLLLTLAKTFLFFKGVGAVTGTLQGVVGNLTSLSKTTAELGGGMRGLVGAIGGGGIGLIGAFGNIVAVAGAAGVALSGLIAHVGERQLKEAEARGDRALLEEKIARFKTAGAVNSLDRTGKNWAGTSVFDPDKNARVETGLALAASKTNAERLSQATELLRLAKDVGALVGGQDGAGYAIDAEKLKTGLASKFDMKHGPAAAAIYVQDFLKAADIANATENVAKSLHMLSNATMDTVENLDRAAIAANMDLGGALRPVAGADFSPSSKVPAPRKPEFKVTINKIEVQSDDPDRFVFGMIDAFEEAARNPSGADSTIRGMG